MNISPRRVAECAVIVALLCIAAAATPSLLRYLSPPAANGTTQEVVQLAGSKDAITLPSGLAANLGVQTCKIEYSTAPVTLEMPGTLMIDADRLSHVHARFAGEVVEIGPGDGHSGSVCFGQRVHKGQVLAVIWSRDLGEKKSDLVDALSQLRVDEDSLERISKAAAEGSVPERVLQDAQRKVEADRIAVSRAVRTLQSWRIPKEEIDHVREEAARILREKSDEREKANGREEMVAQWAKLDVVSPLDGIVIERNVAAGDLVDTNIDLFKIADLSRLRVMTHAYEEDLPSLDALKDAGHAWSVSVGSGPDAVTRPGRFDQVGCIIDPNQHTAMVMGWVDNPDGKLRVGQFVTTRLEIPQPPGEVVVPASALCEESDRTYVFVKSEGKETYVRRNVAVTRRSDDKVYIRSRPTPEEIRRGLEPLAAGGQVVTSRVVELAASLDSLKQNASPH